MEENISQKKEFSYAKINGNTIAVDFDNIIDIKSKYTQTDISNAIRSKDVKKLIEMSNYFFVTSGEYRRLLMGLSSIHKFKYIYAPLLSTKKVKVDKVYIEVSEYLTKYGVESTNLYITFSVLLNGAFYGYERDLGDTFILQELPPQYCRSTFDENGLHAIEFDFRFFDTIRDTNEKLLMFERLPDEFLSLYNEYKAGKDSLTSKDKFWRQLDINFTRCHYLTADKMPFFTSVFSEIINLQEYKEIDKNKSKLEIYRLLVQNLPLEKSTGELAVDEFQAQQMHQNAKKMLGADQLVDVLTTGCEVSSVDLSNKGEKSKDIIAGATTSMFTTIGTSQLLFNSGTSSIGLKESIKSDESLITPLIKDYEKHYNQRLKQIGKTTINFFMRDLGLTIYNEAEKVKQFKEDGTLGLSKLSYIVASTGLNQYEAVSLLMFEQDIKLMDLLIPLSTSYTQSGKDDKGRPKTDSPTDDTVRQQDQETQQTRANA